jgi:para-aminobenzoate synthetase component 1
MVSPSVVDDLLEIHDAPGAFERIEAHLDRAGFFSPGSISSGRRAEVYLGYALSHPSRRTARPAPPEPLDLPLAACRITGTAHERPRAEGSRQAWEVGRWQASWEARDYARAVRRAREAIAAGEVYQVNLVQHLSAPAVGVAHDVAEGVATALAPLRPLHGRPFHGDGWSIVSASPELFLARRGRRIWTMPIKGTRPPGGGAELRGSPKDAAEHAMIVDLERNDLGVICEPGSLRWPELMAARSLAGVEHLVSTVQGRLREDVGWAGAMRAMFPGGSVTGAPKIAALDHIAAFEPLGRGASMGAIGTIWPNGDFELALTIRTFAVEAGRIHLWVGGGIVWDSDPQAEVEESWTKARPLLRAIETVSSRLVNA